MAASLDETIQQDSMKRPRGARKWPPDIKDAWDKRERRMRELGKAIDHIQRRLETKKPTTEVVNQLARQLQYVEDAHKVLASAITVAGLVPERQGDEGGIIVKYQAEARELRNSLQKSRLGFKKTEPI